MAGDGLPPDVHITYARQFRRCGKAGCSACRQSRRGHGPYWYAYWREGRRVHTRYLGRDLPPGVSLPVQQGAKPGATTTPSARTLRVRTLGAFEVWRGDVAIPSTAWHRRKAGILVKCLLSSPGYRLHREQLTELLWPEATPASGSAYLRVTVHQVRKILDQPYTPSHLQADGDSLALLSAPGRTQDDGWLDAAAFEFAATAALNGEDVGACRAALARYGGDYLPDDAYAEWAVGRREELGRLRLALLQRLADLCANEDQTDEAVRCLIDILRADPCHEPAARLLMRLHAAAGRRAEAMRVYRRLATALQGELDLQPEPRTVSIFRSLLKITQRVQEQE